MLQFDRSMTRKEQRLDGGDEGRRPPGGWGGCLVQIGVQKIGLWLTGQSALLLAGKGTARGRVFVSEDWHARSSVLTTRLPTSL